MPTNEILLNTELEDCLPLVQKGKVRDIYSITHDELLFVTTDRVSAFDVSLANGIPNKGLVLTLLTAYWTRILTAEIPALRTHFRTLVLPTEIPPSLHSRYRGRSMKVCSLQPFKIEAIVRGYLTREAWDSYQANGTVCGIPIQSGLREGDAFPHGPIYTPSTKADVGEHDEDISEEKAAEIVGLNYANRIKDLSISIFNVASAHARERGLILVDSKFEFGLNTATHEVVLADEILTPESSRFWKKEERRVGESTPGLDKQFLRDWLSENGLAGVENVTLPEDVVKKTGSMYEEAFEKLVGKNLAQTVESLNFKHRAHHENHEHPPGFIRCLLFDELETSINRDKDDLRELKGLIMQRRMKTGAEYEGWRKELGGLTGKINGALAELNF
ncbi:MAG: hypothetical protein Q9197_003777, partial [Variospora fuerteventurae]